MVDIVDKENSVNTEGVDIIFVHGQPSSDYELVVPPGITPEPPGWVPKLPELLHLLKQLEDGRGNSTISFYDSHNTTQNRKEVHCGR